MRSELERELAAAARAAVGGLIDRTRRRLGELLPEAVPAEGRIYVAGWGKAADPVVEELVRLLPPERLAGAVWLSPAPTRAEGPLLRLHGEHPRPTAANVEHTRRLREFLEASKPEDVILAVSTGGGSAMLEAPRPPLTLDDLAAATAALLASGAEIRLVNAVRRALSEVKGGGLLARVAARRVSTFVVSDVVAARAAGECAAAVASGPTFEGEYADGNLAGRIAALGLDVALPPAVLAALAAPPPRRAAPVRESRYFLLADNRTLVEELGRELEARGFATRLREAPLDCPAEAAAGLLEGEFLEYIEGAGGGRVAYVAGGECPVALRGPGRGGRCQHLAALLMPALARLGEGAAAAAVASDGADNLPGVGGATAGGASLAACAAAGLDYAEHLARCDAHELHRRLGSLITDVPAGANVADAVVLAWEGGAPGRQQASEG